MLRYQHGKSEYRIFEKIKYMYEKYKYQSHTDAAAGLSFSIVLNFVGLMGRPIDDSFAIRRFRCFSGGTNL